MNNQIYQKNLDALKQRFADVVEYLEAGKSQETSSDIPLDDSPVSAEVVDVDGRLCLVAYKDGKCIQLQSLYDDEPMIEAHFDFIPENWELDAKHLMFGLGNGMYVRYFLEHTSDDHKIVVVEPSLEIFRAVIQNFDMTDLFVNERFAFTIIQGSDTNKYSAFFGSVLIYTDIFSFRFSYHANYDYLFKKELLIWDEQFAYALSKTEGQNQLYEEHGLDFVRNNYTFFPYVAGTRALAKLRDAMPEDVPMILVSAGPSLNKNMHELKKAKGKSLIIAVDAAVNPLVRNGIIPDINICVDPSKGEEYISEKGAEMVPLICGMNAGRGLTLAHKGEKILFSDNNIFLRRFFEENDIEVVAFSSGGSVSTHAYSFARYLGAKRVILVGQDLAFTNDESHASGSVRGNETKEDMEKVYTFNEDTDIYGKPIKSCGMFKLFRMWFESQIELFPEIRFIDATEGGALIKGSEIMTLADAIEKECTKGFDFDKVLKKTPLLFDDELSDKFNKYIDSLPDKLSDIKKKINDGKKSFNTIHNMAVKGKLNSEELKKNSSKANTILSEIQGDDSTEYVRYLIQEYTDKMLRTVNSTKSDVRKELMEISDIGMNYLKKLDEAIDELLEVIGEYR